MGGGGFGENGLGPVNWRERGPGLAADESPGVLGEESFLIARAQRGDRDAFAQLVERYWDRLYRWLFHMTHHQQAAEDLTQETFMKALAHLDSFRPDSYFQAWLFRIGYNSFLNQRRSQARNPRQPFPEQLSSTEAGPEEQVVTRESLQLLARAVGRLPSDYRAAFLLRVEQGLSFREIADVLGTTEQNARWRVFKARQKLVNVLSPQLDREKP